MMQINYIDRPTPPLWLTQPHYTMGQSSACDICLEDEQVLNIHAHLRIDNETNTLILAQEAAATISVNNQPMHCQIQLHHGDIFALGSYSFMVVDSNSQPDTSGDGWTLHNEAGDLPTNRFTIITPVIVGRSSKCDIHLDKGTEISRRHARLSVINAELVVEDLGSSNGTYVNGQKINKAHLKHDDVLRFANISFRIQDPFFDGAEDKTSFINLTEINALKSAIPLKPSGPTAIERQLQKSQQRDQRIVPEQAAPADKPVNSSSKFVSLVIFTLVFVSLSAAIWWLGR